MSPHRYFGPASIRNREFLSSKLGLVVYLNKALYDDLIDWENSFKSKELKLNRFCSMIISRQF